MKVSTLTAAACAAVLATVAFASPASAGGKHPPVTFDEKVLADGLLSPLSLDVQKNGTVVVSQDFAGVLTTVPKRGEPVDRNLAGETGDSIGAVSTLGKTIYYAQVSEDHTRSLLMSVTRGGEPVQVADLRAHEEQENPDQVNSYGFVNLPDSCTAQFDPESPAGPPQYNGIVDTNPYATLATKHGVYVADAGANAILKVSYDGDVSTVAVLPPTAPVTATAAIVEQFGFPECAIGYTYRFEPVPTDVEVGPGGWLYVTSLPGGPEDPSLGERGAVYKVNPWSGKVKTFATGFVGATGLAVSKSGVVFVAELFGGEDAGGQVSVVLPWGEEAATFPVPYPAAIELSGKNLYLTTDAFGPQGPAPVGKVVKVSLGAKWLKSYLR